MVNKIEYSALYVLIIIIILLKIILNDWHIAYLQERRKPWLAFYLVASICENPQHRCNLRLPIELCEFSIT